MSPALKRLSGAVLLALLLMLAWLKWRAGVLPELLWMCHVASGILGLGLLFGWARWSAVGFLFHLAVAAPAYLLHLLSRGDTSWVSFTLHLLSPVLGWLAWRGQTLPRMTPVLAITCFAVLAAICFLFTPAALNINLVFKPWQPVAFIGTWPSRVGNAMLMLGLLAAVQWLFNRKWTRST